MAIQTGSTYISESMIDIIKIPTGNLGFTTIKEFEESVCKWLQQLPTTGNSDMVPKAGNTYIFEIMTHGVEIPTANTELSNTASSTKVPPTDWNDRQPEISNNILYTFWAPIWAIWAVRHCHSHLAPLLSSSSWSKIRNLPLEFW